MEEFLPPGTCGVALLYFKELGKCDDSLPLSLYFLLRLFVQFSPKREKNVCQQVGYCCQKCSVRGWDDIILLLKYRFGTGSEDLKVCAVSKEHLIKSKIPD